jgi:Family of unknown function (DUF6544)
MSGSVLAAMTDSRSVRLYRRLARDRDVQALPAAPAASEPVGESDLVGLPDAAQRYLRRAGVLGRPADWSFRLHTQGRFRLRRGWPWLRSESWQYNSSAAVARASHLRIDIAGLVPMYGRDSYLSGRGLMHGRLLDWVTVADGSGPEYDISELVTFLNDAVLFAPSMLLRLPVTWHACGDRSFDVTLADGGHQVTGRVFLDEQDLPRDLRTDDRYWDAPGGPVRTPWTTPIQSWLLAGSRWLPSAASAVWEFPDGPLTYAEFTFRPGDIRFNIAPAALQPQVRPVRRPREGTATRRGLGNAIGALRNWGATSAEQHLTLPGDELIPDPADVMTRAVTVQAPAAEAWRWLVQIGQDRGGMYSYDGLENLLGLRIHSATEIREEWQQLSVGDEVRLVRPGWLGMKDGFALPVARIEPGRAIVLREQPPAQPWNAVWSFQVLPAGERQCRLLSRSRAARQRGPARLAGYAMDPVTLLMTRKMLLGIKERSESHWHAASGKGATG